MIPRVTGLAGSSARELASRTGVYKQPMRAQIGNTRGATRPIGAQSTNDESDPVDVAYFAVFSVSHFCVYASSSVQLDQGQEHAVNDLQHCLLGRHSTGHQKLMAKQIDGKCHHTRGDRV